MSNGLQALQNGLDERFGDIVADDSMVNHIIHTCVMSHRTSARFPVRLVSLIVACAAIVLFTAATVLLYGSGGYFAAKQTAGVEPAQASGGVNSAPASAVLKGGDGDDAKAPAISIPVLVTLKPMMGDNGLYGYIDDTEMFVIAPQFTEAEPFSGETATVVLDGKRVEIDMKGDVITD